MSGMRHRVRDELLAQRRFRQVFFSLILLAVVIGIVIVPIERSQGSIRDFEDGLWWAITTISSVGYGDVVPVTTFGRVLGALLQAVGVVMLGLLVGMMTFALNRKQEAIYWAREFDRFNEVDAKLSEIEKQLRYLVRSEAEDSGHIPEKKKD